MGSFNEIINSIVEVLKALGPISGVLLVILESIVPALPLGVFVAFNVVAFGNIFGFILSWIATSIGCYLSFALFRYCFSKKINKFINNKNSKKINNIRKQIDEISFTNLVVILALPFTPAFLINIAAGLSKIKVRKFIASILISKISIIYFWGYVGKSFIESVTDIGVLIKIGILILSAYVVSKIVGKKFKIE